MLSFKQASKLLMIFVLPIGCFAGDHHHKVAIVNVPSIICPAGYMLNANKQCVGKEEIAPERTCPNGGVLTDEYNCMKTTSPIMKCPLQYTLVGENMCQRNVEVEPIVICPEGFTITDGQMCTGSKTVPPIKKCLEGVLNELQTECILQKTVTPIGECPSHEYTLLNNERCTREVLYDCTPTMMAYTTHHGHHGHGGHGHHNNYVLPQKVVSRTCSKTETVPAQLTCPEGSVKNPTGFGCIYSVISEPTITCSNGSMVGKGDCIEIVTVPAVLQCPNTETKQVNEFYDGKMYSLRNTANGMTPKDIGYGSQYVYNHDDPNYSQPKAIITRRLGKRGGGSHHHNHYGYYPIQRTYVESPVIQEIPIKKCYETETVPGELACPVGYFERVEKGMCKSIVPSSLTCPSDSILGSNGYCTKSIIVQPTIISQQQEVIQTHGHHHH